MLATPPARRASPLSRCSPTWGDFDLGVTQFYLRQNLFNNSFQYAIGKLFAPNFVNPYPQHAIGAGDSEAILVEELFLESQPGLERGRRRQASKLRAWSASRSPLPESEPSRRSGCESSPGLLCAAVLADASAD